MFLHHQAEIPLVRDLGIAIPPGMHTLVASKEVMVRILEAKNLC